MNPVPAVINVRTAQLYDHSGRLITSGTVYYYLKQIKGATAGNDGKWCDSATPTWNAAKTKYGDATVGADGTCSISVAAAVWTNGDEYYESWEDSVGRAFTGESIRADRTTSTTSGSGSTSWPITVTVSAVPIEGAAVWITSDAAGLVLVAGTLYTNSSGIATFMLDPATYYAWIQKSGYNFTNPTTIVVA